MKRILVKVTIIAMLALPFPTYTASANKATSFQTCDELGSQWRDVSGKWVASVGPVILRVNGLHITGIYNQDTWSLDLRYSNDRMHLSGRWSHRNGLEGPVIFHLNKAGCIKHARWGGTGNAICDQHESSACIHDWAFHGRSKK